MGSGSVLLVDVRSPYLEALRDEARRRDLSPVLASGDQPLSTAFCLCVIELDGSDESFQRRIRNLLKLQRRTPVVALAQNTHVDAAVALMKLGVSDVIGLPAVPRSIVGRILDHAEGAGAELGHELVGQNRAIQRLRGEISSAVVKYKPARHAPITSGDQACPLCQRL